MPSNRTRVGPSSVHGIGLFARTFVRRGRIVTGYGGVVIDRAEFDRRYGNDRATFVVDLGGGRYLDARDPLEPSKGKWANDARGTPYRNNAKMVTYPDDRTYLVALRDIRPDEEVLVAYGDDYWS